MSWHVQVGGYSESTSSSGLCLICTHLRKGTVELASAKYVEHTNPSHTRRPRTQNQFTKVVQPVLKLVYPCEKSWFLLVRSGSMVV